MGKRRQSREHTLKILYRHDITKDDINEIVKSYWKENRINSEITVFSGQLAKGTVENIEKINERITGASKHWTIDRMSVIDRNIIRMAVYELLYLEDIPPKVTIDEAIEIAKKFGADDSPEFVNGLLDKVNKDLKKTAE